MHYEIKNGTKIWTKKHQTPLDYEKFHDEDSIAVFRDEDISRQIGYAFADKRIKVLAHMSEGCQAILNVKLFSGAYSHPDEYAVDNQCDERQKTVDQTVNDAKERHCKYL